MRKVGRIPQQCSDRAIKKLYPGIISRLNTLLKKCQNSSNPKKCSQNISYHINDMNRILRLIKIKDNDKRNAAIENESTNLIENYLKKL